MMNSPQDWPEPIVRVQSLSESGIGSIPDRYIKPPAQRPSCHVIGSSEADGRGGEDHCAEGNIPVIDLRGLESRKSGVRAETLSRVSESCREWGFFQVVNHGVSPQLMDRALQIWREFFHLPAQTKQLYANSPKTYEGYGSRLGIEKGAILDWSDYYFLHYLPLSLKNYDKWPHLPANCRYVEKVVLKLIVVVLFEWG